jgi:leader peptidase (prepilin peptidase)/N-methyltransferase
MEVALIIAFALLGAAVGSFLNVCIDRLPAGKSPVYPPSHCESCQHRLSPKDLVPVFSYLWLRRRCRYCQAPIPQRPFWVELGTGFLFAFTCWYYGLSLQFAVTAFYLSLFLVLGVIDLERQLILNKIVYPAAAAALVIDIFLPPPGIIDFTLPLPLAGAINGVMGGAMGFVLFLAIYLVTFLIYKQEAIGFGDVKLAGLIGLTTGSRLVFVALLMGIFLAGLISTALLLLKIKGPKDRIPSGFFFCITTIVTLFWGNDILRWYLGWLY